VLFILKKTIINNLKDDENFEDFMNGFKMTCLIGFGILILCGTYQAVAEESRSKALQYRVMKLITNLKLPKRQA